MIKNTYQKTICIYSLQRITCLKIRIYYCAILSSICCYFCNIKINNSSAVAEMGDRARAKWTEKWGLLCPFPRGAGSPSNTM